MIDVKTSRLHLISATLQTIEDEAADRDRLGRTLDASVPADWPPPLNDEQSRQFFLAGLRESTQSGGWMQWYIIRNEADRPRTVIGNGGFKGAPSDDGMVEIGYSLFPAYHKQGYATEAVAGLLGWAFSHAQVTHVIAETLPDLAASIAVLGRSGFTRVSESSEPG